VTRSIGFIPVTGSIIAAVITGLSISGRKGMAIGEAVRVGEKEDVIGKTGMKGEAGATDSISD